MSLFLGLGASASSTAGVGVSSSTIGSSSSVAMGGVVLDRGRDRDRFARSTAMAMPNLPRRPIGRVRRATMDDIDTSRFPPLPIQLPLVGGGERGEPARRSSEGDGAGHERRGDLDRYLNKRSNADPTGVASLYRNGNGSGGSLFNHGHQSQSERNSIDPEYEKASEFLSSWIENCSVSSRSHGNQRLGSGGGGIVSQRSHSFHDGTKSVTGSRKYRSQYRRATIMTDDELGGSSWRGESLLRNNVDINTTSTSRSTAAAMETKTTSNEDINGDEDGVKRESPSCVSDIPPLQQEKVHQDRDATMMSPRPFSDAIKRLLHQHYQPMNSHPNNAATSSDDRSHTTTTSRRSRSLRRSSFHSSVFKSPASTSKQVYTNNDGRRMQRCKSEPRVSFYNSDDPPTPYPHGDPYLYSSNSNINSSDLQDQATTVPSTPTIQVISLPWTDHRGIQAEYTGEVNSLIQPHGVGELTYTNGSVIKAVWCNGMVKVDGNTRSRSCPRSAGRGSSRSSECSLSGASLRQCTMFRRQSSNGTAATATAKSVLSTSDDESISSTAHPYFDLGDVATPNSMIIPSSSSSPSKQETLLQISSLKTHSFVFIRRSNSQWTYAILADRPVPQDGNERGEEASMRFVVDKKGSTKVLKKRHWVKYIRLVNTGDDDAVNEGTSAATTANGGSSNKGTFNTEAEATSKLVSSSSFSCSSEQSFSSTAAVCRNEDRRHNEDNDNSIYRYASLSPKACSDFKEARSFDLELLHRLALGDVDANEKKKSRVLHRRRSMDSGRSYASYYSMTTERHDGGN